jgi:hypothetical protein
VRIVLQVHENGCLDQIDRLQAASAAGKKTRPPAWRATRICPEIEDISPFDKDVRRRHARNAHLLREASACYSFPDLDLDIAAAVEPGAKASARQEGSR